MQSSMMLRRSGLRVRPATGRTVRPSVIVRAEQEPSTSEPQMAAVSTSGDVQKFSFFNKTSEAINSRSAMLGMVAALIGEATTHHTVFSQMAGKYENLELIEKPTGVSDVLFFGIIALVTVGSVMPKLLDNEEPDSGRSFGPFTPSLELTMGRLAQLGFFSLVVIEAVKGSSLL